MIDFIIDKGKLRVDPSILTVSAFNDIWEHDTTKAKSKASNLLTYVFHVCDFTTKNPFKDLPESQKESYAKRNAFGNQDYKFNEKELELINRAIAWYNVLNKSSIIRLAASLDRKIDQIADFLGDPKNDIKTSKDVDSQTDQIINLEKIFNSKKKTDEFVRQELEKTKIRGGQKLSPMEQGLLN